MNRTGGDSTLGWLAVALMVAGPWGLTSCGSSAQADASPAPDAGNSSISDAESGDDAGHAPEGHSLILGGVAHRPGNTDPLNNCVACHGSDLKGDLGPSCYGCHGNGDHAAVRGGAAHKTGSSASCATCHGPANAGGLGPACKQCH